MELVYHSQIGCPLIFQGIVSGNIFVKELEKNEEHKRDYKKHGLEKGAKTMTKDLRKKKSAPMSYNI